jgi:predicted nucleic acid-binding protein
VTVFVDTSALYALLDRDDRNHADARATFPTLIEREDLLTHSYVVLEAVALVHRRLGAAPLRALVGALLPAIRTTVWVDESAHQAGIAALLAGLPSQVSLVDHVSFNTMRELSISRAFAFDADFGAAGFVAIP